MERLLKRSRSPALLAWTALAAALTAGDVRAQEREPQPMFALVGTVTDQAGVPLVGAFVAPEGSKWGSLTGEAGRFVLSRTRAGEITLTAELIGYAKATWTGWVAEGQTVSLKLVSNPILLEGLTVVADRLASRRRSSPTAVRWFDHNALSTAYDGNALDFVVTRGGLLPVPCRDWSSGCVLARGTVVVPTVRVDESQSGGGLDFLRSFLPHELFLVEIYGGGSHIRVYTNRFMEEAARMPLWALIF